MATETHDSVKKYYGQTLQTSDDLKTNACCTDVSIPAHIKKAIGECHDEVLEKYYGCGIAIPNALVGAAVLDLGSGSGRDVYTLAQLVGAEGRVVGVDMTDEQLEVANRHVQFHADKFGFANVEFKKGLIERLDECGLADASFDVVTSNCVINLCPDKNAVLREIYRVLKPGGEFYFSDVYANNKRVPDELVKDEVLYGECLSGALYVRDFVSLAIKVGFAEPQLVESAPIAPKNPELEGKLGDLVFSSRTYRLWKVPGVEAFEEDYGQTATYRGSIPFDAESADLCGLAFPAGTAVPISGNIARIIAASRYSAHFEVAGSFSVHKGAFVPKASSGCGPKASGCGPAASSGCGPAASSGCGPAASSGCGPAASSGCGPAASSGCGPKEAPKKSGCC